MSRPYSSIFSYYGGKSKLAEYYPAPIGDVVIEPFCGGASYSLLHYQRQVIINDKDDVTASIWRFLLQADAMDLVERYVPRELEKGTRIDDIFDRSISEGLFNIMRSLCAPGSMGADQVCIQLTEWGAHSWNQVIPKLSYWIPKISHWQFQSTDYSAIPNQEATWFIDPPYNNPAGSIYRTNDVNFQHLAQWSRERQGQVIVCENEGADWLPFKPLHARAGSFTGRDGKTAASGGEVVYIQGERSLFSFDDWA